VQVYTLPVALYSWNDPHLGNLWGPQAALAIMSMVPILAITLFLQRHIVRGLTLGAVKG